jgi:hypothetical protein
MIPEHNREKVDLIEYLLLSFKSASIGDLFPSIKIATSSVEGSFFIILTPSCAKYQEILNCI